MARLHCDYFGGQPAFVGYCTQPGDFYLVNQVQRPLCTVHALKLARKGTSVRLVADAQRALKGSEGMCMVAWRSDDAPLGGLHGCRLPKGHASTQHVCGSCTATVDVVQV